MFFLRLSSTIFYCAFKGIVLIEVSLPNMQKNMQTIFLQNLLGRSLSSITLPATTTSLWELHISPKHSAGLFLVMNLHWWWGHCGFNSKHFKTCSEKCRIKLIWRSHIRYIIYVKCIQWRKKLIGNRKLFKWSSEMDWLWTQL